MRLRILLILALMFFAALAAWLAFTPLGNRVARRAMREIRLLIYGPIPPGPYSPLQCTPENTSAFPLSGEVIATRYAGRQDLEYIPPATFDFNSSVQDVGGRYYLSWNGCGRWFEYAPMAARAMSADTIEVELCLGPKSRVRYVLKKNEATQRLDYAE